MYALFREIELKNKWIVPVPEEKKITHHQVTTDDGLNYKLLYNNFFVDTIMCTI